MNGCVPRVRENSERQSPSIQRWWWKIKGSRRQKEPYNSRVIPVLPLLTHVSLFLLLHLHLSFPPPLSLSLSDSDMTFHRILLIAFFFFSISPHVRIVIFRSTFVCMPRDLVSLSSNSLYTLLLKWFNSWRRTFYFSMKIFQIRHLYIYIYITSIVFLGMMTNILKFKMTDPIRCAQTSN